MIKPHWINLIQSCGKNKLPINCIQSPKYDCNKLKQTLQPYTKRNPAYLTKTYMMLQKLLRRKFQFFLMDTDDEEYKLLETLLK